MLDFASSDGLAGYRLDRFEFYNWGTFDGRVWTINPAGNNALLTGDIGSGKSTIVDALTTLLVPPKQITYNKAAGAEGKERSLRTYVRGDFKSQKDDDRLSAKAVSLRDNKQFSVLLGHFVNQGFGLAVTLAQVFWMHENDAQPKRFYLLAEADLGITRDFTGFENIRQLKRRLRAIPGVELFDSFNEYAGAFRRKLGISSSKAMDLFYQTVSMKSVGNLTDFVRGHMLEPGDYEANIQAICRNFDNLNQAHEAVVRASRQIEMLTPLIHDADRFDEESNTRQQYIDCREVLGAYFAKQKAALLEARLKKRRTDLARVEDRLKQQQVDLQHLREQAQQLKAGIAESGGKRLEEIEQNIRKLTEQRDSRQRASDRYHSLSASVELPMPDDEQQFHTNRNEAKQRYDAIEQDIGRLEEEQFDSKVTWRELNQKHADLQGEVQSLEMRQSNIPRKNLAIRAEMCEALGLDEERLPFVGELLRVREDQSRWQGAAERLLHNFGLSLIVPDDAYTAVSRYVDQTHLRGRLVYYRVRPTPASQHGIEGGPAMLWRKLQIKPDSEHFPWLEAQLARRFGYHCCDDLDTFRRMPKAVTASGQVKAGGERHEKDDRHRIDDPARFVLGWSNKEKVAALRAEQAEVERRGKEVLQQLKTFEVELKRLKGQRDAVRDLMQFESFNDIDWQAVARQVDALDSERQKIEASSDVLKTLRGQLAQVQRDAQQTEKDKDKTLERRGTINNQIETAQRQLGDCTAVLDCLDEAARERLFPLLHAHQPQALGDKLITVENCDASERALRDWLQAKIDAVQKRINELGAKMIRQMQAYRHAYPAQTREADASLDAISEFRAMLGVLVEQDLPRHKQRFKALLNEGTIQEIVLLQNQLAKEARDIAEKIETINQSLRQIDYNAGTYIRLNCDRSQDPEVSAFKADLRACVGETLGGAEDEVYTEAKFVQVKALIDRFGGREGLAEQDRRWTRKVADVRNWFEFSASERWAEDDEEREFYSDSAGKSGGQKEKLAYTILASALAYQFGLKIGETRSKSFRFVVIDEAFGRGSDESARYGLEIFKKLNLQLLIITPLQKIHVIEDYIQSVHLVHNADGKRSQLRSMSLASYREQKKQKDDTDHETQSEELLS